MSKPNFLDVEPENKNQPQHKLTPFSDEELSDPRLEEKIQKLLSFFGDHGIDFQKFEKKDIPTWDRNLSISKKDKKVAYPNVDPFLPGSPIHDTQKWLETVRQLYWRQKNGENKVAALKSLTSSWKKMEIFSFLNWLRFYEGGNHMKYKVAEEALTKSAQKLWYEGNSPGYFLEVRKPEPKKDIDFAQDQAQQIQQAQDQAEKKSIIEHQRSKIIGRLDSAEKLLRSHEGQIFAGKELQALMEAIFSLKTKIQLVNKVSASIRLYEDMIIREANVLNRKGFTKAGEKLRNLAEEKDDQKDDDGQVPVQPPKIEKLPNEIPKAEPLPSSGKDGGKAPSPTPPNFPTQPSGAPGGLPSKGPGMPQIPEGGVNEVAPPKGISEFFERLDGGKISNKDEMQSEDNELEVSDGEILVSEAQEVVGGNPNAIVRKEKFLKEEKPLEVSEGDPLNENGLKADKTPQKDFDAIIDSALRDVSVNDVILKLEQISQIFKAREIPRQIALADMMLSSLGLSSFFGSMAEILDRSLSSAQYCSVRLDDILGKLKGAVDYEPLDLEGTQRTVNPEGQKIRDHLENEEEKDQIRKEKRKAQQDAETDASMEMGNKPIPEIEIEEDLTSSTPSSPAPRKPISPPAV